MKKNIETEPMAKIDYVEAVDALSMEPVEKLEGTLDAGYGSLHRKDKTY